MKTDKSIRECLLLKQRLLEEQLGAIQSEEVFADGALYEANRSGNENLLHESYQVKVSIKQRSAKLLQEIREALQKIDKGGYGLCNKCGHEIEPARLLIVPTTTLCIRCM